MENLNAEQIIKALERNIQLSLDLNYGFPRITYSRLRDTVALIISQEQRIKELAEENERLRAENEIKSQKRANIFEIANAFERGRTDGVRKMQEALEHRIHSKLSYHGWYLKETVIAEITKEMLDNG